MLLYRTKSDTTRYIATVLMRCSRLPLIIKTLGDEKNINNGRKHTDKILRTELKF